MTKPTDERRSQRYGNVHQQKANGATYTPLVLANFVANKMLEASAPVNSEGSIRLLDPAVGEGQLLNSLLHHLPRQAHTVTEVYGFDTDPIAISRAAALLKQEFPAVQVNLKEGDFLDFVLKNSTDVGPLSDPEVPRAFDYIIANPPYVRTQILGSSHARLMARRFGLSGRLDLYHAFVVAIARVLKPDGTAGIIVSNRFMTTKSGASVRMAIQKSYNILHVWDLGDTRIFGAAVLPAVLLLKGNGSRTDRSPNFTSIYETRAPAGTLASDPLDAVSSEGVVRLPDGRIFMVQHGNLETGTHHDTVWRISTQASSEWLVTVENNTWGRFADIGKIRVGVKTCADTVFIRSDWQDMPETDRPELLRPLTTHHVAHHFRALRPTQHQILYPHEAVQGKCRAVDLAHHPRSRAYLEKFRSQLEARRYVIEAGRMWYEIWVPQDPAAWALPKLVFRDIAAQPVFWIDWEGTVVNGDCYWLVCNRSHQEDLLWLAAAVGNSTFAEAFYDRRFHNRLYSGRRRFMTQYVNEFPLPHPHSLAGNAIVTMAKELYAYPNSPKVKILARELDRMVWEAFGLDIEEIRR